MSSTDTRLLDDVALAAQLGLTSIRLDVPWTLAQPRAGGFDGAVFEHLHTVAEAAELTVDHHLAVEGRHAPGAGPGQAGLARRDTEHVDHDPIVFANCSHSTFPHMLFLGTFASVHKINQGGD